jgi:iron complex transport system substrate-binding protein
LFEKYNIKGTFFPMKFKVSLRSLLLLVLATACTSVVAQATSEPVTPSLVIVTDLRGKEFSFEQPAARIVSLAPSNTEILFAVGAGKQVVGRDTFSDYPAEALNVTDIGGGFGALDTETILASTPDLVLAGELTPAEQVQALEDLGLRVFVLGNPLDLQGMYENLRIVASMTGHVEETETLVTSLQERVADVEKKLAGVADRPLVLYELDGTDPNAPWVPGPGTFIDTLLKMAGANSMSSTLEGAWVQVSLETIIESDPEIILLGDATWGGVTPEMVAARGGWDALTAIQNGNVFPFDDNLVSRPGPRLVDGLEQLAKLFHPDLLK